MVFCYQIANINKYIEIDEIICKNIHKLLFMLFWPVCNKKYATEPIKLPTIQDKKESNNNFKKILLFEISSISTLNIEVVANIIIKNDNIITVRFE